MGEFQQRQLKLETGLEDRLAQLYELYETLPKKIENKVMQQVRKVLDSNVGSSERRVLFDIDDEKPTDPKP